MSSSCAHSGSYQKYPDNSSFEHRKEPARTAIDHKARLSLADGTRVASAEESAGKHNRWPILVLVLQQLNSRRQSQRPTSFSKSNYIESIEHASGVFALRLTCLHCCPGRVVGVALPTLLLCNYSESFRPFVCTSEST
jgi:hypothetical protein